MMVKEGVFQLQIFLTYLHRNNYARFTHFQMIHLQIHLILITPMHGPRMEGEEGNPPHQNLELMEEIIIHQQVENHLKDHQMEEVQQKVLDLMEKGLLEDTIGKLLMQEHMEVDHQEIHQEEVEEDMEEVTEEEVEDHTEEDHHQEAEDPLEEAEDPQEEEDYINPKVIDLSIYPLIILIQN